MSRRAKALSAPNEGEFLSDLRARGIAEVEFDYTSAGQRRIRRVTFQETSEGDIRRALEAAEAATLENLTRDLEPEARNRVEARRKAALDYHSS